MVGLSEVRSDWSVN